MALVREIVEFIRNAPYDDFRGAVKIWLDNWSEAIRRPSVSFVDERLEFTPGSFDATVARAALTVKGCTFVRSRDDPTWRPKDEDDLIGVRSFVNSTSFQGLGFKIEEIDDVQKCREVTMRVVSELLNDRVFVARWLSGPYRDWATWWFDFDGLRKKLLQFDCNGYAYERGRWIAKMEGENLVGPSACALALLESLDDQGARSHFYANFPADVYASLQTIAKDDGNEEMQRLVSSIFRGRWFRANYSADKRYVFLLLSQNIHQLLCRHLSGNRHELSRRTFDEAFRNAWDRWEREEEQSLLRMKSNAEMKIKWSELIDIVSLA